MSSFNWTCPFCHRPQTITEANHHHQLMHLHVGESRYGSCGIAVKAISCQNTECSDVFISALLCHDEYGGSRYYIKKDIQEFQLRPSSSAKPQSDCIPEPIRSDYYEACAIAALSPKASATLSRRCLQGMIRDFCQVREPTLNREIQKLIDLSSEDKLPSGVTIESVEAIDHVRKIGNIGAHMEKDIGVIVDIDAGEAQSLIEVIELLFDEWYVARDNRRKRLARVREIADQKALLRDGTSSSEASSNTK